MKFDYKAIAELIALAEVKKKDPVSAKIYGVFMKRGISMAVATEILLEMLTVITEAEDGEEADNDKS